MTVITLQKIRNLIYFLIIFELITIKYFYFLEGFFIGYL